MSGCFCVCVCKAMLLLGFLSDVRLRFVQLILVLEKSSGNMPALGGDYSNKVLCVRMHDFSPASKLTSLSSFG